MVSPRLLIPKMVLTMSPSASVCPSRFEGGGDGEVGDGSGADGEVVEGGDEVVKVVEVIGVGGEVVEGGGADGDGGAVLF